MDTPTHKIVNGILIPLSTEEQEAIVQEWELNTSQYIPSPVEMWQVKVWLARKNISLSTVSGILSSKIPEGAEREEALIRWEYVTVVPYDNILVGLIASELNLDKETAWREIRSI